MDQTTYGRVLMGDSLGFHIIFALLGVGIPLLICIVELLAIVKKDNDFYVMAKRWTFVMLVLFVVGSISGTIISVQLVTMWPKLFSTFGKVIGLPFSLETYAFFLEAIFLGIYAYTWGKVNKILHWLFTIPIVLGGFFSAFFITTANSFLNHPQGFVMENGFATQIDPFKAMFNPATFTETTHSITSYYLTTGLFFAGVYGLFLLKKNLSPKVIAYNKKAIVFLVSFSLLFALLIGLTGDRSAKYVAEHQPIKFAAMEAFFESQKGAPLQLGGLVTEDSLLYAIKIPYALSFLAFGSFDAVVKGLNEFHPSLWPPLYIHYMFDAMVGIGFFIIAVIICFLLLYKFKREWAFSKLMLIALFLAGLGGFFAVEFGWIVTEVGRQPFIVRGFMKTTEAFTTSQNVKHFAFIFPILYVILFIALGFVLWRYYKNTSANLEEKHF